MKIIGSEKRIMFVKSKACIMPVSVMNDLFKHTACLRAKYVHTAVIVKVYYLLGCDDSYSGMSSAFHKNLLAGSSFMGKCEA
jgi:hypothetical protein